MYGVRNHFLAGPAFSLDQNASLTGRHSFDEPHDILHALAFAHDKLLVPILLEP